MTKWACAFLTVLSLCLWPLSYRGDAGLELDNGATEYSVWIQRGGMEISARRQSLAPDTWLFTGHLTIGARIRSFQLGALRIRGNGPGSIFSYGPVMVVPFWHIAVLTGLPAVWLFCRAYRDQRAVDAMSCLVCGYDLAGLPTSESAPPAFQCPECGTRYPMSELPVQRRWALMPLWPWPVLWALFWCEVLIGLTPEAVQLHLAIGTLVAVCASTLTAAAVLAIRKLRRGASLPSMAAWWLYGNDIFVRVAWFMVGVVVTF